MPPFQYFSLFTEDKEAAVLFLLLLILTALLQFVFNLFLAKGSFDKNRSFVYRLIFVFVITSAFFTSLELLSSYTSQKVIHLSRQSKRPFEIDMMQIWRIKSNTRFRHPPDRFAFTTDSNSMRSTYDIPIKKEKDETRILHLGDSWTFGFGLNDDQTYSYLLNEMLKEKYPHKKITNINAGFFGSCLAQGVIFLEHRGLKYDPDIIVIKNYGNSHLLLAFQKMFPINNNFFNQTRSLLWKSSLFLYLRRLNHIRLYNNVKEHFGKDELEVDLTQYESQLFQYELDLYNYAADISKKHGADLIYLQLSMDSSMSAGMEQSAVERNYPVINVLIDQSKDPVFHKFHKTHPGPNGAKDIADALFNYLVENRLLENR